MDAKELQKNVLGCEMFFVHKGTWENNYEWRIEKVKITAVKLVTKGKPTVDFSHGCVWYEYPLNYLKPTMKQAKSFTISQINKEKIKQIASIKSIPNQ